jgi:two-component system sensor histidine kinase QseC
MSLVLGTTIGAAIVLLAAGTVLYWLVRTSLLEQFDLSLIDKARLLAAAVEEKAGRIDAEFDPFELREFEAPQPAAYLQLWLADGSVLFRSASLGEHDLPRIADPLESPLSRWVKLADGRTGRAVGVAFSPKKETDGEPGSQADHPAAHGEMPAAPVTLVLARATAPIESTLVRLEAILLCVGLVATAVSTGVLWSVVQRSLRPLDQWARQIGRLDAQDLSARIDVQHAPRELHPVADRLNELLARLEAAFRRERSFSADVAHELRTPLAGLRATLDVTLSKPRRPEEYQEAVRDCLQITVQMQAMVENLLSLARLEGGQVQLRPQPVFVNELLRADWERLQESAAARRLQVQWTLSPEQPITTDPALLGLVVGNLLDNAVAYADEGGWVRIETVWQDGAAVLRVSNSGSMIGEDQTEQVFERFWRGDAARSATGTHAGLGLALVKKLAELLGGSVKVQSRKGGRFEVTFSIVGRRHADQSEATNR